MRNTGESIRKPNPPKPDAGTTILDQVALSSDGEWSTTDGTDRCYQKGASILGTYRVESDAIESGGMGRVWCVHHTGWNVDLAMKQPRAKFFTGEDSKQNFIRECDTWIKLGLHPNIVSCYYVRLIDGIPTIFSEWMDGGDLAHAISSGSLYTGLEGNPAHVQEHILDIAIQFARGLHYAHEAREEDGTPKAIIHQDVKPGNVLLTKSGEVKVTDFGLARARSVLTILEENEKNGNKPAFPTRTILCPSGGYTPAYCSMEQMDGKLLSRRTDLYSWAVSVMELYVGSHPWANGVVAGLNCRMYLAQAIVPVPAPMADLLARCLAAEPDDRPRDFGLVIAELRAIYRIETGEDYPRESSQAASDTADSLNNRALSMVDLGKLDEAEKLWEKALRADFSNFRCQYNYAITLWNRRKIDDVSFYNRILAQKEPSPLWMQAMATISLIRRNNDKEAKSYVEQLASLDPSSPALESLERSLMQQLSLGSSGSRPSSNTFVHEVLPKGRVHSFPKSAKANRILSMLSPDGRYFLNKDGACLDAKTGNTLWCYSAPENRCYQDYRFTAGGHAMLQDHDRFLLIDCETGEVRFDLTTDSFQGNDFSLGGRKAVFSHPKGKGYTVLDLVSGQSRQFGWEDGYLGAPRFVDTCGTIIACTGEDVRFFDTENGRSLLTFISDRDYEDDVYYDDINAFTDDGLILIKSLKREVWIKRPSLSLLPVYELSKIASHFARSSALSKCDENYRLAQTLFDQGDIIGAFHLLDQSRLDSTLQQHAPSLVLWTKLGAYFKRGKLITVLPTSDAPTPLPKRGETQEHSSPERLLYAAEGSSSLHVYTHTKMTWAQDTYFEMDYSYSLNVYNTVSDELYFSIERLTTDSRTDKEPLDEELHVTFHEDGRLEYTKDTWSGPAIINLNDPTIQINHELKMALPGGYRLQNTKNGVDIGGFLFQDVFEGITPLWNTDIVVCKKRNYRLVYQYILP